VTRARDIAQLAVPFIWFGMVAAISLIEAPLKFRAPGITRALGLGIGRLVFRALNLTELVLLLVLTVALFGTGAGLFRWAMVAGLWLVLLTQVMVLRPLLDQRAQLIIDGNAPPPSALHVCYIALEGGKLVALAVLGVALASRLLKG
jgi:hypothetical protein